MGKLTDIELALGHQKPENAPENDKKTITSIQPVVLNSGDVPLSIDTPIPEKEHYVRQIVWFNVIKIATLHVFGLSAPLLVPFAADATIVFMFLLAFLTLLGVQVGAHRLWAHRSYKANFGVRLFLCLCHTMSMQNDLYEWVRDHRSVLHFIINLYFNISVHIVLRSTGCTINGQTLMQIRITQTGASFSVIW